MKTLDLTSDIIAYENGELEDYEVVDLFQNLLDTGLLFQLQGSYQRTAAHLILNDRLRIPERNT
jgi:hypothetical protein